MGCPRVLHVSFSGLPGLSLVLHPRGRLGGLEGIVGSLVRNVRTTKVVCWVNISRSSDVGSPGQSQINGS